MNKRKIRKENRGITLIALVITIIVLLILAGVAIATLTGENGILNQAGNSKEATQKAQAEEEVNLTLTNLKIDESQRNMTQDEKVEALLEDLRQFYPEQQPESTVSMEGTGFLIKHRGYEFNEAIEFDAEEWDNDAAEEDCFYWASNDPNSEDYGTIIGYTKNIDNYPILRFPSRCTKIEFSYNLNYDGVTTETSRAFTNNIQQVEIPGTVTSIGTHAFGSPTDRSFQKLEKVVIEYGLTSIGSGAFRDCTSLTNIGIPDSVTSIGYDAFSNTAWYNNQPDGVVYVGKVALEYKGTMPSNTNIQIKEGITNIANSAFSGDTGLSSITIPDSVTNIEIGAFSYCTNLENVVMSKNVTYIGQEAFSGCTKLSNIIIWQSVNEMGYRTFGRMARLANYKY